LHRDALFRHSIPSRQQQTDKSRIDSPVRYSRSSRLSVPCRAVPRRPFRLRCGGRQKDASVWLIGWHARPARHTRLSEANATVPTRSTTIEHATSPEAVQRKPRIPRSDRDTAPREPGGSSQEPPREAGNGTDPRRPPERCFGDGLGRGARPPQRCCVPAGDKRRCLARPRRGPSLSLSPGLSGFPWWLVAVQNVCATDDDDRRGRVGAGIRQRKGIPPAEADGARDRSRCYRQEGARTEHDSKPVRARRGREGGHRCKSPDEIHTGFTNQKIGSRNVVSGSRCPPPRTSRRRTRSAPTRRARSTAGRGASTTGTTVPKRSHREDPGGNGRRPHPVTSMPDNNGMVPAKEKSSRNDPSAFQRSFTVEEAGVWNECLDCKKRHRCGGHLPEVLFVDRSSPSTTALRGCRFAGRERWRRGRRIDPTRDVPFAAAGEGVVVASEESAGTTDPDGLERGRVGHGLCLRDVSTSCRGTPRRREEQRTKTHHHRNGSPVLGCGGWFVFCFGNCLEHKWQAVVGFFCELNVRPPIESESEEFSVV